jgi:hypothetical protein
VPKIASEEFDMTREVMLGRLNEELDEYEGKYRHPALPSLRRGDERGDLYALFPEGKESTPGVALCWNDQWPNSDRTGVYVVFGYSGRLLYVGKADFIGKRLGCYFSSEGGGRCRIKHSGWSEQPMYVTTVAVPDESSFEVFSLEQYLIRRLDPCDNTAGRLRPVTI